MRLAIEKPCTQKWASLEKTATGRYCASCDHEVVDFTTWPEEKILDFLSQAKGKVCGRLQTQSCRTNPAPSRNQPSLLGSPLLVVAGILSLNPTGSLLAQNKAASEFVPTEPGNNKLTDKKPVAAGHPTQSTFNIQGRLVNNENAKPVPGVTVLQVGTN